MEKVLFQRPQPAWQKRFCRVVYLLLGISVVYYSAFLLYRFKREVVEAWPFPSIVFGADAAFYVSIGVVAIAFFAIYLCLHDRVMRGAQNVVISDDQIRRSSAANRALALLTTPSSAAPNVSRMSWSVPRTEIRRIIVSRKGREQMVIIEHSRGTEYLSATQWVSEETMSNSERAGTAHRSRGDFNRAKKLPLIEALVEMNYPISFS